MLSIEDPLLSPELAEICSSIVTLTVTIFSESRYEYAAAIDNRRVYNIRPVDPKEFAVRNSKTELAKALPKGIGQKKSFFDSVDFFPEPKDTVSIYGEIEKRLKMRGIDEPSKDLETLKHILEALQLKGLLRSKTKPRVF